MAEVDDSQKEEAKDKPQAQAREKPKDDKPKITGQEAVDRISRAEVMAATGRGGTRNQQDNMDPTQPNSTNSRDSGFTDNSGSI